MSKVFKEFLEKETFRCNGCYIPVHTLYDKMCRLNNIGCAPYLEFIYYLRDNYEVGVLPQNNRLTVGNIRLSMFKYIDNNFLYYKDKQGFLKQRIAK